MASGFAWAIVTEPHTSSEYETNNNLRILVSPLRTGMEMQADYSTEERFWQEKTAACAPRAVCIAPCLEKNVVKQGRI
jgi:hypothetical protein